MDVQPNEREWRWILFSRFKPMGRRISGLPRQGLSLQWRQEEF
jgi:hypothetical protein